MADPEHVKWLREDVEAWNARRREGWFKADLREANLRVAILQGADLREADLLGADLRRADLRVANLLGADLREANLRGANLRGADLRRANLRGAILLGADLREADLLGADLREADLLGADVTTLVNSAGRDGLTRTAEYTDFSTVRLLKQSQVDMMQGDSGTILPEGITRPAHWPEVDLGDGAPTKTAAETALENSLVRAAPIDVEVSEKGIGASIPSGQAISFRTLDPNCASKLDALVENALTIASSTSNLGQDTRDDLTAYADHVTNNDPANPHRLVFLAKGIVAETTDPMKIEGLSNRVRTLLAEFQTQHHDFLTGCIPTVAEAVAIKDNAVLTRSVSKEEATAILDSLDQSINDTEAVMESMAIVLKDLRDVDDKLNQFSTKVFTESDKAKLDRAVEGETKELAAIAARVYYRAQQVVERARTTGGDIAIAATVTGKTVPDIAAQIVTALRPLMEKLGELLTILPPL